MKMVVGLGNPGRKYANTRHNIGYRVLDEVEHRYASGSRRSRFDGDVNEIVVGDERTLLVWPQTYMNLSGSCVQPARDFYKLENTDLLIVGDDFSLPLGRLRFRTKGSSGGQKGLADILQRLGTEQVPRLRIGIGTPPEKMDPADFVLSRFRKEEESTVQEATTRAADAVIDWVSRGIEYCMNEYNAES